MKKSAFIFLIAHIMIMSCYSQFQQSLSFYADKCDSLKIGTSLGGEFFVASVYDTGRTYDRLVKENFNALVAGNDMKFDAIEPQQGVFNFTNADLLVAYAKKYKMIVRGHTLLWHEQLPAWIRAGLTNGVANGTFTRQSLQAILKNHITTVVSRYAGKVQQWDVVNEAFDDGSTLLRNTIWKQVIGDDYIDSAFVWARRADPKAKLYLNDYSVEFKYSSKADKMYNYVVGMQERKIPIDGVGMQCHFVCNTINFSNFDANFKRYNALGLECIVTELDVRINKASYTSSPEYWLARQAEDYRKTLRTCLDNPNAKTIMMWGFTDKYSWIPSWSNYTYDYALPFDYNYAAKPAYNSMITELVSESGYTSVNEVNDNNSVNAYFKNRQLIIHSDELIRQYSLYNTTGVLIASEQINDNAVNSNIQNISKGIYVLVLSLESGLEITRKVILY